MNPNLKTFGMAVLVAIIAGVASGIILRMVVKEKTKPDGTKTASLLGMVDLPGTSDTEE